LIVGGATWLRSDKMAATDSMAPAPPSRCPVIDLVDVTITPSAAGPRALARACASSGSPSGVDVAWALTCTTCAGSTFASAIARPIAEATPAPSGAGCAM